MAYTVFTQIVKCPEALVHQETRFVFGKLIPLQHESEQITSLAIVCYNEKHLFPFPDLSDVQYIGVIQFAEDLVFADEA